MADYDRRTALHLAASNNCLDALKYLIKVKHINLSPDDHKGGRGLHSSTF